MFPVYEIPVADQSAIGTFALFLCAALLGTFVGLTVFGVRALLAESNEGSERSKVESRWKLIAGSSGLALSLIFGAALGLALRVEESKIEQSRERYRIEVLSFLEDSKGLELKRAAVDQLTGGATVRALDGKGDEVSIALKNAGSQNPELTLVGFCPIES